MSIISLIGYMGSGKSTYGKILSKKLNFKFIDLDDYIEENTGLSIKQIFSEKGEKWFRSKETECLNTLFKKQNTVIALGGGTPINNNNMDIVNKMSLSIYLNATPNTLYKYLKYNREKRPIISDLSDEELLKFITSHLKNREEFYKQSKIKVTTDNKSISEIVDDLLKLTS